jgi:hypothetical protein
MISAIQRCLRVGSACAVLLWTAHAVAEESKPGVEYHAPPGCPDAAAFQRSLDARLAPTAKADPRLALRGLRLDIEARSDRYVGELRVRDAEGLESQRELAASTCEELVDAMAFLAAVSATLGVGQSIPPPAEAAVPAAPRTAAPVTRSEPPLDATKRSRWRFAIGSEATVVSWVGPSLRLGPEPLLEARYERDRLVSPVLRLSGTYVTSESVSTASLGGTASLTFIAARLESCPIRWRALRTVAISPCVGVRGGVIEGTGANIIDNNSQTKPWLSAELLGRVEWTPVGWLFFEAQGGGSVPFFRYDYLFNPGAQLTETPAVGWFAGAGGGVRFP